MTAWYGGVLAFFVIAFAVAVYVEATSVVWTAAANREEGVAQEIESFVRAEAHDPFGPVSALTALADQSTLDSFAGPGIYAEVYNSAGYRVAKTTNLGDYDLPRTGYKPWHAPSGLTGEWSTATTPLGPVLVRTLDLHAPSPANITSQVVATAYIAQSLEGVYTQERGFGIFLLVSLALALAAIIIASTWLARSTVSPINAIARATREIGGEDLAKRLNWKSRRDELGVLAATFDQMLARLEAAFLRERRLVADASHELKTPLTVISSNAQMLERWADQDEGLRREAIATIRAESASMARVLNALLTLAKTDDPRALSMEPTDAAAVVKDAASALRQSAESKGLSLSVSVNGPAWVMGEPGLLRQLVTNLTENAIKFTNAGSVSVAAEHEGTRVRIVVADTGPGIPAEALPHVFDRFYRADPARSRTVEGTGLGLAVVKNIVRIHDGTIRVASDEGKGTRLTVELPTLDMTTDGAP